MFQDIKAKTFFYTEIPLVESVHNDIALVVSSRALDPIIFRQYPMSLSSIIPVGEDSINQEADTICGIWNTNRFLIPQEVAVC